MDTSPIPPSWHALFDFLNRTQKRLLAAEKAIELGHGGIQHVHEVTGLNIATIRKGIRELTDPRSLPDPERVRREGGGRKKVEETDPGAIKALEGLLEGDTAGLPTSHLRWTHKSLRRLAKEMTRLGHTMNPNTVARLLDEHEFSRQVNAKTKGKSHPDRDQQFKLINRTVSDFIRTGDPVISVDAKKHEKIGEFRNPGTTWRKAKHPKAVNDHDFMRLARGIAIPHGTFDPIRNEGFVNVGVTHETAEFAVHSIREWWRLIGRKHYPKARRIMICVDAGGSNSVRNHGWKLHLQKLVDDFNLPVRVCHYPPGTSKWNKIEHRMFSYISTNWQGTPLESYATVISLISNTTTVKGLHIAAKLDRGDYKIGVKIPAEEWAAIRIIGHGSHPEWNYTISPRRQECHGI